MLAEFPKAQALFISIFLYLALIPFTYLITMRFVDLYFPVDYAYVLLFSDWFLTTLVYILSVIVGNCSLIDFYWTIWPLVQLYYTFFLKNINQNVSIFSSYKLILVASVVTLWGVRLTYNYVRSWIGYKFVDFRIAELLEKLPKNGFVIWFVLYLEYFLAPGLFLYFAKAPIITMVLYCDPFNFNSLHLLGFLLMIFAVSYQTIADKQLFLHREGHNHGKILDSGVWYYSRHPNYFGEMSFWWGAFIFSHELYVDYYEGLWFICGPMGMTILFHFMTGPWMDRHICRKRPEYKEYMKKNRSIVIPWFRKAEKKEGVKKED